jgi:hypothetical protein
VKLSSRCKLPTFLLSFRAKLILNRLPTRQERSRRGDKHTDGSPVALHCPHCPTETETHEHALINCSHHAFNRLQLLYEVTLSIRNTTSTLYKQGMQDAGRISALLDQTTAPTFLLTDGWRTWYTDKHGRNTETGRGPKRVTLAWGTERFPLDNVHTDLGDRLLLETGFLRPAPPSPPRVWYHSHT